MDPDVQEMVKKVLKRTKKPTFQTLAVNIPGIVYRVHLRGHKRTIFFNDTLEQMTGYKSSELMTGEMCSIDPIIISEDHSYVLQVVRDALRHKTPFEIEYRIKHKNGGIRYFLERGIPVYKSDGKPEFIDGVILDITERKQIEDSLSFKDHVIKNSSSIIATCDLEGNMTYGNPSFLKQWGFEDPEEFLGKPFWKFWLVKDRLDEIMRTLRSGESWFGEVKAVGKDGAIFDVQVSAAMVFDSEGNPFGLTSTSIDMTEHKRVVEALRESEEKFRSLVETTSDWIWEVDADGVYTYASPRVYDLLGYEPEEVLGRKPFDFMPPDESARILGELSGIAKEPKAFVGIENVNIRKDGQRVVLESSGVPRLDARGNLLGYRGIDRNITYRKHAEKVLKMAHDDLELRVHERTAELKKRAEQLTRLSSELTLAEHRERSRIAKILHDHIQQLLVGAKINQELLINSISKTTKSAAELVLDLINRAIKEMRSLNAELAPPVLNSGDLSASLKWLARWMHENQSFDVKLKSETSIVLDRKDLAVLLFQSIRELLFNALKHSGVKSAAVKMERQNGNLRVVISDQGVGFNAERAWNDAESDQKFGLISIRERLQYLGGRLEIESTPNAGSAISLIVPLDEAKSTEKEPLVSCRDIHERPVSTTFDQGLERKIHVMVADDHAVMREGLSRMLISHPDIEVVGEASDGEEAVHLARELLPDVILMDIRMPNMDGLEATRIIHAKFPHIRIIGLSMYDEEDQAALMTAAGAFAYRLKSGNTDSLLAAIRGEVE